MKQEQPKHKFFIQVNSDLNALGYVLDWFTQISESKLSQDCSAQCQTMLAEGFTNAVRHAHKNHPPQTLIDIKLIFYEDYLEMQIWDSGQPFDLEAKLNSILQQKPKKSLMEIPESGRGLKFINALTDKFNYIRDKNRNCLIMRKSIE